MMTRRNFIRTSFFASLAYMGSLHAKAVASIEHLTRINFKTIYTNPHLKNEFLLFLTNVFNLFPEKELHQLIETMTKTKQGDKAIYLATQKHLDEISPMFSLLRYQIPALRHQKDEMCTQTVKLLGEGTQYNGYLELGSSGRYLDYLEEDVDIEGQRYYIDVKDPGYGIDEMVDRGQIAIGADFIPLNAYKTDFSRIEKESLELVCVYIGFHHIPLDLRKKFIVDLANTMKVGAKLILRDHDCYDENQTSMVGLAHDVFNMGTNETWAYNERELRNFYSLKYIQDLVESVGFELHSEVMYQKGDPTKNALMMFTKVQDV